MGRWGSPGWAAAAVLLVAFASTMLVEHNVRRAEIASAEHGALVTEVFDQHVATLAADLQPEVVSTDRHTVKPWFQGKIPFSFNLPENLPRDTRLDGANLTYLRNQPVAQLLYSIGKHRVSVFVQERAGSADAHEIPTEHAGFHVIDFGRENLEMVAISDVDPGRLAELVNAIRQAQIPGGK
jgi:anti-sigma factor RsiW